MKRLPLSSREIATALEKLPGWMHSEDKLCKGFRFHTFLGAMRFVNQIAEEAEAMNHHPSMHISFVEVMVTSCTHDAGNKVTPWDVALATRIERCYQSEAWKNPVQ